MNLATHLNLVPRLKMSGAITLFPLHVSIVWTATNYLFTLNSCLIQDRFVWDSVRSVLLCPAVGPVTCRWKAKRAGGRHQHGIYDEPLPKRRVAELVPSAALFGLTDIAFLNAASIVSCSRSVTSSSAFVSFYTLYILLLMLHIWAPFLSGRKIINDSVAF
jgi:hypothetical protein